MALLWDIAREIADEAVDHFSMLHPHIRMNRGEWSDLHEMIEREVFGHFSESENAREVCAHDVSEARLAVCGSPRPS